MVWLTGGGLAVSVAISVTLLAFLTYMGLVPFWPTDLVKVRLHDGRILMGEVTDSSRFEPGEGLVAGIEGEAAAALAQERTASPDGAIHRRLLRTGNFDLTRTHFTWVSDYEIAEESRPDWGLLLERMTWGRFYGEPAAFLVDGETVATGPVETWSAFQAEHAQSRARFAEAHSLKKHELGHVNAVIERARLDIREAVLDYGADSPQHQAAQRHAEQVERGVQAEKQEILDRIAKIETENQRYQLELTTADGATKREVVADIVRAVPTNQLDLGDKIGVYASRWGEFLTDDPREANAEGGVLPAIFGTVIMTLIMTMVVVPFGVLAALYLREYAKGGPLVSIIRIAINNLAGVPSIVFGVFGLGFFCYLVGGWIDGGPDVAMPIGPWVGIAVATVITILVAVLAMVHRNKLTAQRGGELRFDAYGAVLGGLAFLAFAGVALLVFSAALGWLAVVVPLLVLVLMYRAHGKRRSRVVDARMPVWLDWAAPLAWMAMVGLLVVAVWFNPFFDGFYRAKLPNPTYGTGGIMWAAFTLALLTLPVVIVATEEALAAVPSSMREGSYACGASKWQTIQRIVLPRAMPGIMTGTILAMARGAGEVAPLMLVGAVKLAPELPLEFGSWDGLFGFLPIHPERSFMHLGFHIFDLGFQSQNSEAAKPMVYTTTLLLISIVVLLNIAAIFLRGRLRRRFGGSQF
jgi:phosphate transport system permease protein